MNMENELLLEAKALYKDRIRIALSAFIIVFSFTFFVYYTTGIAGIGDHIGGGGITQGLQVVAAFNNFGLIVAVALMVFAFRFWSWAFLPGPASLFTMSVLKGILGPCAIIQQSIGKRFKVTLDNGLSFSLRCSIEEKGTDEWFTYRLMSNKLQKGNLRDVALRHGFSLKGNRFVASVSNDELHHRTLLLAKAMIVATASL
jgi:hypothetical protein